MNETTNPIGTLEAHRLELAERILQVGFFLDSAFGDFADNYPGHRALGIDGKETLIWAVSPEELDINKYRIGRMLPFLYDYAYNARRAEGTIDWSSWNDEGDDRAIFGGFIDVSYVEAITFISGEYDYEQTALLPKMLKLADARYHLDFGDSLSIDEIALLADMNERSVRNALRADGENCLVSDDGESVASAEALRWLRSRRGGFKETTVTSFHGETLPSALTYAEISVFIDARLQKLFPILDTDNDECWGIGKAARMLNWPVSRLFAMSQDTANINPKDCAALAKVLRVDPAWFTEQVMCALFPKEMSLIAHRRDVAESAAEEPLSSIKVVLSASAIKHGYLDIPAAESAFFPADCFGGRGGQDKGSEIELRYGGQSKATDIRVKSSITISPRARFISYFSTLRAKPGDSILVSRIDERTYELVYLPQPTEEHTEGGN